MIDHKTETQPLWDIPETELIEFVQAYDDGCRVAKRGLEASPMVIRKFDIGPDEVMSFTNHVQGNRAMTAFHFHPEFPIVERCSYMERHEEGHALAAQMENRHRADRRLMRSHWQQRIGNAGRGLMASMVGVAMLFGSHGSVAR